MNESAEIVVVGGGAAGLAASIAAAESLKARQGAPRILLVDGANTLGAKILVSGGGRCNVTHHMVTAKDFFGNRHIVKNVLAAFPAQATIDWFASLGVPLKREDTGKMFPVSDKARTVIDALLDRCRAVGVGIRSCHRVTGIHRLSSPEGGFVMAHRQGVITARTVIVATGGRSLPKTGSDGSGYDLVRALGHDVTPTVPALVPLRLSETMFHHALSGLSQEVELTTVVQGRMVERRTGSLLWTHTGISGPVVMDASRHWTWARAGGDSVELYGNFVPGWSGDHVRSRLQGAAASAPQRSLLRTLAAWLPERMAEALCRWVACDPQKAGGQLRREERQRLVDALTRLQLPVEGDRGWNHAEVTAGGVPLEQVDFRTMESKIQPGLYLVGEILDCDGRIGGFNFQWAWATGILAGRAVARKLSSAGLPPGRSDGEVPDDGPAPVTA